jgi:hypothetical protein
MFKQAFELFTPDLRRHYHAHYFRVVRLPLSSLLQINAFLSSVKQQLLHQTFARVMRVLPRHFAKRVGEPEAFGTSISVDGGSSFTSADTPRTYNGWVAGRSTETMCLSAGLMHGKACGLW